MRLLLASPASRVSGPWIGARRRHRALLQDLLVADAPAVRRPRHRVARLIFVGAAVAVAEKDIQETLSKVWKEKGWSICPEGAACLAAIPQLVKDGLIKPGNKVVVFNTGSLEKYLPDLQHLL